MRDSIVFYKSHLEPLYSLDEEGNELFSDTAKLQFLEGYFRYAFEGVEPNFSGLKNCIFTPMKPQIDANNNRFENGKKGGRPKKTTEKTTEKTTVETSDKTIGKIETDIKNPKETIQITNGFENKKPLKKPNKNVNVNVNENVNENDDDNAPARGEVVDVLKCIVIDCDFCHTIDEYRQAAMALSESKWAKENMTHLSKIHRNFEKLLNGYYKDSARTEKTKDEKQNVITRDFSAEKLNAVFDKLNEELL